MGAKEAHSHLVSHPHEATPPPGTPPAVESLESLETPPTRRRWRWWWLDVALLAAACIGLLSSWLRGNSLHRRRASCAAVLVMVVYAIPTVAHGDPVSLSCPHTHAVVSGLMTLGIVYAAWSLYQQARRRVQPYDDTEGSTEEEGGAGVVDRE